MKFIKLFLIAIALALITPAIVSAACTCYADSCDFLGIVAGLPSDCFPSVCTESAPFCCCTCLNEGEEGCLTESCCGNLLECSNNHCCQIGEKYNLTSHKCECVRNCAGKTCGSDGCGGTCPPGCTLPAKCNLKTGKCCTPDCAGKTCGNDGCGGTCGDACGPGTACDDNSGTCTIKTECVPNCPPKSCGPDGCEGTCAPCTIGETCRGGLCVSTDLCTCGGTGECGGEICASPITLPGIVECIATMDNPVGRCVDCAFFKGEWCEFDTHCNFNNKNVGGIGTDCALVTDYQCTDMRCCARDEMWVGSRSRCEKIICVLPGGSATAQSQCCQPPNTPDTQYLNVSLGHCCPKGSEWVGGMCVARDPCYSPISIFHCNALAVNYPSGPGTGWWGTPFNTYCVIDNVPPFPDQACCWLNDGLYGYVDPSSEFYSWHRREDIVIY